MKNLAWSTIIILSGIRLSAAEPSDSEGLEKEISKLKISSESVSQENFNDGYSADNERANSPRSQQADDALLDAFAEFKGIKDELSDNNKPEFSKALRDRDLSFFVRRYMNYINDNMMGILHSLTRINQLKSEVSILREKIDTLEQAMKAIEQNAKNSSKEAQPNIRLIKKQMTSLNEQLAQYQRVTEQLNVNMTTLMQTLSVHEEAAAKKKKSKVKPQTGANLNKN